LSAYIYNKSTYKEIKLISTHGLRGSSLWSVDPTAFRTVVRQHIMTKAYFRTSSLISWPAIEREEEGTEVPKFFSRE
jgi:hypothetical protein